MNTPQPNDPYLLDRTEAEIARLRAQAQAWEEATLRALAKAGLAAGMHAVDIGCGPAEVMRLMAGIVGTGGHVTGIDIAGDVPRAGIAALTKAGHANLSFQQHDITAGEIPGGPYDFVFERLTLMHMSDPVDVLARMARALRPGGVLLAMDFDITAAGAAPALPAIDRALRIHREVTLAAGLDPQRGRQLTHLFREAGLTVTGTDIAGLNLPGAVALPMYRGITRSMAPSALRYGVASEAELAEIDAALAGTPDMDRYQIMLPLLHSCWGGVAVT